MQPTPTICFAENFSTSPPIRLAPTPPPLQTALPYYENYSPVPGSRPYLLFTVLVQDRSGRAEHADQSGQQAHAESPPQPAQSTTSPGRRQHRQNHPLKPQLTHHSEAGSTAQLRMPRAQPISRWASSQIYFDCDPSWTRITSRPPHEALETRQRPAACV